MTLSTSEAINIINEIAKELHRKHGLPPADADAINGDERFKQFLTSVQFHQIDNCYNPADVYEWHHEVEHYNKWIELGFKANIGVKVRYKSNKEIRVNLFVNPEFDDKWNQLSELEQIDLQIQTIKAPTTPSEDDKKGLKTLQSRKKELLS